MPRTSKITPSIKPLLWVCVLLLLPLFCLAAQDIKAPAHQTAWPGLRWLDAKLLVRTLSEQPGLMMAQEDGSRKIVWAKKVGMQRRIIPGQDFPGKDGPWYLAYGPWDPSRWDILINGVTIDPRDFFIQWDGEIHNLGMLFTFREDLPEGDILDEWESPWQTDTLPAR